VRSSPADAARAFTIAALLAVAGSRVPLALAASEDSASSASVSVVRLRVDSIIQSVVSDYVRDGLAEAERNGAAAVVIDLETPGGVLDSTREITTAMLGSRIPVVVYVAPQGARAASAGFILLMAGDVAAMAPETNAGAAHPVGIGGATIEGVMAKKVEEDTAAYVRSLATRNGRDIELAQSAVIESKSFTAGEALQNGLVDYVAADLPALLGAIDGRKISKNGVEHVLHTRGAKIDDIEMTAFQRVRSVLADPNVAPILISIGMMAVYFELASPGAILPGVVGAFCFILGLYGLSVLPVSYAGIALLILAAILFLLEIKVAGFGVLGGGGVIALVLGLIFLFKSTDPAVRVSLELVLGLAVVAAATVAFLATMALRARRRRVATGREGMMSELGFARTDLQPRGKVSVHGEIWDAVSDAPVEAGQAVEVVGVDGLLLRVQPAQR
jgi:membrane-bound serine protease (ClpP class)